MITSLGLVFVFSVELIITVYSLELKFSAISVSLKFDYDYSWFCLGIDKGGVCKRIICVVIFLDCNVFISCL